jgi:hypothetical protein
MTDYIEGLAKLGDEAKPVKVYGKFVGRDGRPTGMAIHTDQVAVNRLTGATLALWDELMAVVRAAEHYCSAPSDEDEIPLVAAMQDGLDTLKEKWESLYG